MLVVPHLFLGCCSSGGTAARPSSVRAIGASIQGMMAGGLRRWLRGSWRRAARAAPSPRTQVSRCCPSARRPVRTGCDAGRNERAQPTARIRHQLLLHRPRARQVRHPARHSGQPRAGLRRWADVDWTSVGRARCPHSHLLCVSIELPAVCQHESVHVAETRIDSIWCALNRDPLAHHEHLRCPARAAQHGGAAHLAAVKRHGSIRSRHVHAQPGVRSRNRARRSCRQT